MVGDKSAVQRRQILGDIYASALLSGPIMSSNSANYNISDLGKALRSWDDVGSLKT